MVFKADTGSRPVPFKTLVMTTGALACFLRSKKWEKKNSSLTRVQPVFDYINLDIQKLNQFLSLFDKKVSITSKILFCKYGENEASIKPPFL